MSNGYFKVEMPKNEPVKAYLPGSPERASLKKELERQSAQVVQVPMIIGGKEVWTGRKTKAVMPHDHAHVIAEAASGGEKELKDAQGSRRGLSCRDSCGRRRWRGRACSS